MFENYGYFTIRDVYPTFEVGVSTSEKTKINGSDNDQPTELTETKAAAIKVNDSVNTGNMIKFFAGLVLLAFLVNRFGK